MRRYCFFIFIIFYFCRGVLNCGGAVNHFMSGTMASWLHLGLADEFLNVANENFKVLV